MVNNTLDDLEETDNNAIELMIKINMSMYSNVDGLEDTLKSQATKLGKFFVLHMAFNHSLSL